ncbi:MAG: hypothetical protein ACJA0S_001433 [Rickettsiales bacterium]|jgi:hypothetical protein
MVNGIAKIFDFSALAERKRVWSGIIQTPLSAGRHLQWRSFIWKIPLLMDRLFT